jgi:hypothetical protein
MENKDGWNVRYSELLGQDIAYKKNNNGEVDIWTEDKTHYKNREVDIIKKHGKIDKNVHIIKRMFCGEIIE